MCKLTLSVLIIEHRLEYMWLLWFPVPGRVVVMSIFFLRMRRSFNYLDRVLVAKVTRLVDNSSGSGMVLYNIVEEGLTTSTANRVLLIGIIRQHYH